MSPSAVLAPALHERDARALVEASDAPRHRGFVQVVRETLQHLADRFRASFAFHDRAHYDRLVRRTASLVGYAGDAGPFRRMLRSLDPQGLGVWCLARIASGPRLDELCKRAIATRAGPPRPVARLLEQSLAGKEVCWFGESGGFEALAAETLLTASVAAGLTAIEVAEKQGQPDWPTTLTGLTLASSSLQTAVRAYRRVSNRPTPEADDAVNHAFQAANIARRVLNHTDLLAVDERLASELMRLAVASANSACTAALSLSDRIAPPARAGDVSPIGKLASLARTLDALLARITASQRDDARSGESAESLTPQFARVLVELHRALRPWGIQLMACDARTPAPPTGELSRAANDLLEASAETLDGWCVLHEIFRAAASTGASPPSSPPRSVPAWATQLMNAIGARTTPDEIVELVRQLAGPADRAVAAAVGIAALRADSLQLRRELWKLIRAGDTPDSVRLISFQLFWRLRSPALERSVS